MIRTGKRQSTSVSGQSCYLKCGAAFLLLSLSALVIACGSGNTTPAANSSGPQVTVTIKFNNNLSPLGTMAPYLCGAWVTNSTPALNAGSKIPVYARFIHNVNGNPVGVNGASATASVIWANGGRESQSTRTTSDGLAVFYFTIPNQPNMVGKNNLVMVSFSSSDGQTCRVDNQPQPAAFFTFVAASPTPTATPSPTPTMPNQPVIDITPPIVIPSDKIPTDNARGKQKLVPTPTCANILGC